MLAGGGALADVITISTDAHVRGGLNADNNYGTSDQLWVRDSSNESDRLKAYLEADAGSILGAGKSFSEVSLGLKSALNQASSTTFSLYGIVNNSDSWTETGVDWNNAPQNDTTSGTAMLAGASLLATLDISAGAFTQGSVYIFADNRITEYLNWTVGAIVDPYGNGASADTKATFVIVSDASGQIFRFASAENTSFSSPGPTIEYEVVPEPATLGLFGVASLAVLLIRRTWSL